MSLYDSSWNISLWVESPAESLFAVIYFDRNAQDRLDAVLVLIKIINISRLTTGFWHE